MPPVKQAASTNIEDTSPTFGLLAKLIAALVGMIFTLVVTLVPVCFWFASLKSDIALLRQENQQRDQKIAEVEKASLSRHDAQEREIQDLNAREGQMGRKLDVIQALVERIDKKVGQP